MSETLNLAVRPAQRTAARVAGAILLLAMAISMLAEFVGLGGVEISNDAAVTARSLVQSEAMVRLAVVGHLICFISDIALAAALYVILRPVSRGLAACGAFLRLADGVILALSVVPLLIALRLLGGAPYVQSLGAEGLQSLARLMLGVRAEISSIGWVFLGLGQAVFAWLWLRSRYIPRILAAWGVFASLLLGLAPLVFLAWPQIRAAVGMAYMAPMFLYEVPLGVWLLIKGLRSPASVSA